MHQKSNQRRQKAWDEGVAYSAYRCWTNCSTSTLEYFDETHQDCYFTAFHDTSHYNAEAWNAGVNLLVLYCYIRLNLLCLKQHQATASIIRHWSSKYRVVVLSLSVIR